MLWLAVTGGVSLIPSGIIRLAVIGSQVQIPFDAESASVSYEIGRYTHVLNGLFYGLNPGVLFFSDFPFQGTAYQAWQAIRVVPVVIGLLCGLWALRKLKQGPVHWYVLSCVLLVLFATVPYTGWILGYFASARLILALPGSLHWAWVRWP